MLMDKNSDMYRDYSVKFKNNIKEILSTARKLCL